MNNKYTIKKFNMKISKLSPPKYLKNKIKIKEKKILKNVEMMILTMVLFLLRDLFKNLNIISIRILNMTIYNIYL